jgi:transposase
MKGDWNELEDTMDREHLARLSKGELIDLVLEQAAQLEAQAAPIEVLKARIAQLESKLDLPPKTPANSSRPPSQGQKAESSETAQPKCRVHPGAHRALHLYPTAGQDSLAMRCPHCGTDVSGARQVPMLSYDPIEIPEIIPDITRVTRFGGVFPRCRRRFIAEPPAALAPGLPFGPNLRSFVIYLRFTQAISFERLAHLFSDLLGVDISEGALVNRLKDTRSPFAKQKQRLREKLLSRTILDSDETTFRVGKKNWYFWVFRHGDMACFVIEPSHGKDVPAEFLGPWRSEIWVSDRLAAQKGWATKDHQFCLAHLLRDAQFVIDAGDTVFAPTLQKLLRRACAIDRRRDRLADSTLKAYRAKLEAELAQLLDLKPTSAEGRKLQAVIKKIRPHLFIFITNRDAPATNNVSEQALRFTAVFRKVVNGFRSTCAAKLLADIRSVLETARRRSIPPVRAIRLPLGGMPLPKKPELA